MKIFSWVHRKLNQKDGLFDRNVKNNEVIISKDENIGETELLLQDDSMAHLLGGWKGGILTIGTFGFDPLIKDELNGLNDDVEDNEECEISTVNDHDELISHDHEVPMANMIRGSHILARRTDNDDDDESNKGSNKKERITLADLFSADLSDEEEKVQLPDLHANNNNKNKKASKSQVKNGVSFAKKIIPRVREDSRRILKLQQMMTRVLKRKVHPDMENKNHKNSNRVIAAAAATMLDQLSPAMITSKPITILEVLETSA